MGPVPWLSLSSPASVAELEFVRCFLAITVIQAILILVVSFALACRADEPKPLIQSAEQAILRFREVRDTQLKAALPERAFHALVPGIGTLDFLTVRPMQPSDYQSPHADALTASAGTGAIFGSFASVTGAKHGTWRLHYETRNLSGVLVYLDAVTGDILCIQELPEG